MGLIYNNIPSNTLHICLSLVRVCVCVCVRDCDGSNGGDKRRDIRR